MFGILEKISRSCDYLFNELYDDRTRDTWPGVGSLTTILVSYLYFCTKAGPAWMKDRKPYNLTRVIFYYNIFQIIISSYIAIEGGHVFLTHFNLICQPVLYEDTPRTRHMHNLVWIYFNLKVIELLDTVFFVLRKKIRQISSLHLYHHFLMPICAFIAIKYLPNGHSVSLGIVNSFVHMIMYTYYLIAGLGPKYQKLLWWKNYLTLLQLIQFVIVFIHNLLPLIVGCAYPRWINATICLCSLHFIYMFANFYYENYVRNPQQTTNNVQKLE